MFQVVLFYVFAILILFSAFMVIMVKNTVYACLWLIFAFCVSACLWILMQAEFLGIVLVMVYVGAVMVLFLFVVMMLDIDYEQLTLGFWKNLPLSFVIGLIMSAIIILVVASPKAHLAFSNMPALAADYSTIKEIGKLLMREYVLAFELAAVLLVLGMIAAIALVHRKNTNPKYIQPASQLKANPKDRIRIIKMPTEQNNNTNQINTTGGSQDE